MVRQQCTRSDSTSKIEGECRDTKESPAKHQSAMWRCARRESEANCKAGEGGGGKLSVKPIVQDWAWMANPYLENSQDCKILRTAPNGFFNISLTLITGIRSFLMLSLDDAIESTSTDEIKRTWLPIYVMIRVQISARGLWINWP